MTTKLDGLPEGYEAVRYGKPNNETVMMFNGIVPGTTSEYAHLIVRKIQEPPKPEQPAIDPIAKPLTVEEAQAKNVCRYCQIDDKAGHDNPFVLNYGREYAHRKCIEANAKKPAEQPAIDVGEGWRLLESYEIIKDGDQYWSKSKDKWFHSIATGTTAESNTYRRRTEPQSYTSDVPTKDAANVKARTISLCDAPQATYAERQAKWVAENGVKVGSRVKVLRKAVQGECGYEPSWSECMNKYVGQVIAIKGIANEFINISGLCCPYFVLEPELPVPKSYRPFVSLSEWWPHRDRWSCGKGTKRLLVVAPVNLTYCFENYEFINGINEDGSFVTSPFGMEES